MRTLLDRKQQFPGNSGLFRSANISGSWNTTCFRGSNLFGESVLYEFVFLSTFSSIIADYPKPLTLRTSCRKTPGEIPNGTLPMCCSHHFTGCFLKSCTSRDDRLMSHVYVLFVFNWSRIGLPSKVSQEDVDWFGGTWVCPVSLTKVLSTVVIILVYRCL